MMDSSKKYVVGKTPEGVTFYDFGDHIFYCNGGAIHSKAYPDSVIMSGGACSNRGKGAGAECHRDTGAECHKERGYCG